MQQHEANAEAMRAFIEHVAGTLDPREEAAYDGVPKDEFEWELFLRASDRRATKLGELMETIRMNASQPTALALYSQCSTQNAP
jgi:hypothetical protein